MSDRTYYVICGDDCRFEGLTKEQIIAAIAEATGNTVASVDDAFITKIKEQNANTQLKFWVGTSQQYNAITTPADDTLYILTDDTFSDSVEAAIEEMQSSISSLSDSMAEIYDAAYTLNPINIFTDDYVNVHTSIYDAQVKEGLYMMRVTISAANDEVSQFSMMFDFSGEDARYSATFTDKARTKTYVVKAVPTGTYGYFYMRVIDAADDSTCGGTVALRKIGNNYNHHE